MRRILAMAGVAAVTVLAVAPAAYASPRTSGTTSHAKCNTDWYVNPDEAALRPKQLPQGLLFDGPSLIHHATSGYTLKSVPTNGGLTEHVFTGSAPLFKMETSNPYSTINKSATGKWWSSKIAASEAGGQSNPVDSPADLIGKYTYTESTTIISFGVGYGNDTGNKALVTSVSFGGHVYRLACRPGHSSPTPTPTPTTPGGDSGSTPTAVPSGAPQTGDGSGSGGADTALMAAGGLVCVLGAGSGLVLWRRRGQH